MRVIEERAMVVVNWRSAACVTFGREGGPSVFSIFVGENVEVLCVRVKYKLMEGVQIKNLHFHVGYKLWRRDIFIFIFVVYVCLSL